jgi:hypothetical protein
MRAQWRGRQLQGSACSPDAEVQRKDAAEAAHKLGLRGHLLCHLRGCAVGTKRRTGCDRGMTLPLDRYSNANRLSGAKTRQDACDMSRIRLLIEGQRPRPGTPKRPYPRWRSPTKPRGRSSFHPRRRARLRGYAWPSPLPSARLRGWGAKSGHRN